MKLRIEACISFSQFRIEETRDGVLKREEDGVRRGEIGEMKARREETEEMKVKRGATEETRRRELERVRKEKTDLISRINSKLGILRHFHSFIKS